MKRTIAIALLLSACATTARHPADLDPPSAGKCPKCDEALSREEKGFRDDRFEGALARVQAAHKAPKSDEDYKINSWQLLGSLRAIVARDPALRGNGASLTNRRGQKVPVEALLSFHRQLKRAFLKFGAGEAAAEALAQNALREAVAVSGLPLGALAKAGGPELLKDEELTGLVKRAGEHLWRTSTLDSSHDVPFIAGYAADDPKFIFIDRMVPKEGHVNGKRIRAHYLLNVHERVEKLLLDEYGLTYQHAHQIAQRTERRAAKGDGVGWLEYDRWMEPISDKLGTERPLRIHPRLDMTCYYSYTDDDNLALVREMEEAKLSGR